MGRLARPIWGLGEVLSHVKSTDSAWSNAYQLDKDVSRSIDNSITVVCVQVSP